MQWPLWRVAVAERSMEPALRPGDWLLVRRGLRAGRPPRIRPGQLVIARHPGQPDLLLVKRAARRAAARLVAGVRQPRSRGGGQPRVRRGAAGLIEGRVLVRYWRSRAHT